MSLSTVVTSIIGVSAFVGAGVLGSDRFEWGRPSSGGSRFGTRRPFLPPPGRRVPPHSERPRRPGQTRSGRESGSSARWAGPRELGPITVRLDSAGATPPGRLVLGRTGRHLVAAEPGQSVIVFGATQSHKTSGFAVPALLEWAGPVVAASVKTDLVDHTIESCAFIVEGRDGAIAYSGDTGPTDRLWTLLNDVPDLRALLMEVSFPNREQKLATVSGHHTPRTLAVEIRKFRAPKDLPTLLFHIKPSFQAEVERECAAIQGANLTVCRLRDHFVL